MAIYRSSDSMSRCEANPYSSLYDVRRKSSAQKQPIVEAPLTIKKDTIELSRDKLKAEGLNRIRHVTKYTIVQNSFMRIGKYLFLAVALPPYLFLYGLPKWILAEGLPALLSFSVWVYKKIHQQVQKQIHAGTAKVMQAVYFIQRFTQTLLQPFVHLALAIQNRMGRLKNQVIQPLRRGVVRIKNALEFPFQRPIQAVRKAKERLTEIKQKMNQRKGQVISLAQQGIQWMKESPAQFLGWGQTLWQRLSEQTNTLAWKWKGSLRPSQQFAQQAVEWIASLFEMGARAAVKPFHPFVLFYRTFGRPHLHGMFANIHEKWSRAKQFFGQRHRRALAFIQNKQEKLKRLSYERLMDAFSSSLWVKKLPVGVHEWIKHFLAHPTVRELGRWALAIFNWPVEISLRMTHLGLTWMGYVAASFGKCTQTVQHFIRLGIAGTAAGLAYVTTALKIGSFYALYYFLLTLTIAAILIVWGFGLVARYSNSLFSRLKIRS